MQPGKSLSKLNATEKRAYGTVKSQFFSMQLQGLDLEKQILIEIQEAKSKAELQPPVFPEPPARETPLVMASYDINDEEGFLGGGKAHRRLNLILNLSNTEPKHLKMFACLSYPRWSIHCSLLTQCYSRDT